MSSYVLPVLLSGAVASSSGDLTAPVISAESAGTPTDTGATITWTTDENSNSQVIYGLTSSYGSQTILHAVSVTSHSEAVSGLSASTTYHYRAKSTDAAGNNGTSASDHTFTTAAGAAPVISAIDATPIGDTTATIVWTTDIASNSQVVYGLTSGYGSSTTLDPTTVTSHSVNLTGLDASTGYHYAVKSGVTTSTDRTFTTTGGSFDPGTLTELVGWYKTPIAGKVDTDGLSTWPDSSSAGNTLLFSGGTSADTQYKTAIRNGLDIVRTANNTRTGVTTNAVDLTTASLYFVGVPAFAASQAITNNAGGEIRWFWNGVDTDAIFDSASNLLVGPATSTTAWGIHSATLSSLSGVVGTDGVDGASNTTVAWPNSTLGIIASIAGITTIWWGDVGEILLCTPKLSPANHASMIAYLKDRWDIT